MKNEISIKQKNGDRIKRNIGSMFPPTKEDWIKFEEEYKKWQREFDYRYKNIRI